MLCINRKSGRLRSPALTRFTACLRSRLFFFRAHYITIRAFGALRCFAAIVIQFAVRHNRASTLLTHLRSLYHNL